MADGLVEAGARAAERSCAHASLIRRFTADFATLMPQVVAMGQATTARLLAFSYCTPPSAIAEALHLGPQERVHAGRAPCA